jgi:hypothetical protein
MKLVSRELPVNLKTAQDAPAADPRLPSIDFQKLWFQTQRRPWSSLVVVPADPGRTAAEIAISLGKVGTILGDSAPKVLNAERMGAPVVAELIADLSNQRLSPISGAGRRRIIISIESILSNPLGIGVAQAADTVLLCVRKRRTKLAAARTTIELIGREHFVGSVILSAGQ